MSSCLVQTAELRGSKASDPEALIGRRALRLWQATADLQGTTLGPTKHKAQKKQPDPGKRWEDEAEVSGAFKAWNQGLGTSHQVDYSKFSEGLTGAIHSSSRELGCFTAL